MAQTYANLKANIAQQLQDTAMSIYATGELTEYMDDALRELSDYVPYVLPVSYSIESRVGIASSTSSGKLVDATKSQFTSADVGKVVWNTTDYTWALVTAFTSSSEVSLSKDIMASGENYEMFNAGCRSSRELNLVNVLDYHTEVQQVEFPVGYNPPRYRNFELLNANILRMKYDGALDDSRLTTARKEVLVYIVKRHVVSQLSDLGGTISGAHAAGATSIALAGLTGTESIEVDQEFTIAGIRGIYTVATGVTLADGAGTVVVYPGLESAAAGSEGVTLKLSTLTPRLEILFCDLVAGRAAIAKASKLLLQANTAITTISTGATAIGLVATRIVRATDDLALGRDLIPGINIGEPVGGYASYASREIAAGIGRISEARGSFDKAGFELRIAGAARGLEAWGQQKVALALSELARLRRPRVIKTYSRG